MSILGELIVKLSANTASFTEGMSGAAKTTRTAGREIESAFSHLGSIASSALAPLGEVGSTIASTLGEVGTAAGGALATFGKMGGAMGVVGGAAAAAAAGLAAVDLGAIALSIHTAESIAKLGELAQSTGVSVGALSALGFAGKAVGIDIDTMAKSLEKMDKAVFKAATSPEGAINAFTRLHIAVRDASGQIKPTEEIFGQLAARFEAMPDGVTKTALAIEIFGRGGAVMVPLLNRGKQGIEEFIETAKALGIVLDDQTAKAAEKFKEDMAGLEAAGQGVAIRLTKDLLPALDFLTEKLVEAFKTGEAQKLVDVIADLVKTTLLFGEALSLAGQVMGTGGWGKGAAFASETSGVLEALPLQAMDLMTKLPGLPSEEAKKKHEELAAEIALIWKNTAEMVRHHMGDAGLTIDEAKTKFAEFREGLDKGPAGAWSQPVLDFEKGMILPPAKGGDWAQGLLGSLKAQQKDVGGADLSRIKERRDIIAETIGKLRAQTAEEAALANAISGTTANTILATAAAEAEKIIAETNVRAKQSNRQLTEAEKQDINELTTLKAAYNAAHKDNKGLEDFIQKTDLEVKSLNDLAAAYHTQSGLAVEQAKEREKLAPYDKQIAAIKGVIAALTSLGATNSQLAPLINSLGQLQEKFATAQQSVHALFLGEETDTLKKATFDIGLQTAALEGFIPAALGGAAAMRQFNIEQQVKSFKEANPLLSPEKIDEYRQSLIALDNAKRADAAADAVAASQSFAATQQRIADLEILRDKEIAVGQDTSATDLLIYQEKINHAQQYMEYVFQSQNAELFGQAQLFDLKNRLIHQWDESAIAVGKFRDKFKGIMGELVIQGRQAGAEIAQAFLTAIDGIETQLAKFLTGQKTNFKQVLGGLAESIVKAQIHKGVGIILEHLGLGGKPDGTPGNPLHVAIVRGGALGGVLGGAATGEEAKKGGWVGKVIGALGLGGPGGAGIAAPDGTQANPFYVLDASLGGGAGKGMFGGLFGGGGKGESEGEGGGGFWDTFLSAFGSFGGGGAEGMDMMPGHWYLTGEKGTEAIIPKSPATVVPFSKMVSGGKGHQSNITINVNGVKDYDLFRRSEVQIRQAFFRELSIAHSRY
jgi:hypothetical protein